MGRTELGTPLLPSCLIIFNLIMLHLPVTTLFVLEKHYLVSSDKRGVSSTGTEGGPKNANDYAIEVTYEDSSPDDDQSELSIGKDSD